MDIQTAAPPASPNYGFDWYVHKHRREHEAASWDESRVQALTEAPAAPIVSHLLLKFAFCAIALTAGLGILVTFIH